MSRIFRVINGTPQDQYHDRNAEPSPRDQFDHQASGVPFVEVGGPEGIVNTATKPRPTLPSPNPKPPSFTTVPSSPVPPTTNRIPTVPPPVSEKPETRPLSVTFHRIPKMGLRLIPNGIAPDIVTYHFPDHTVSSEYRTVRDEIVRQFDEPGSKITLFTSATGSSGTTTVLLNLAVSLIQEYGSRVLVVDANFTRPGVARRMGCAESPGIAEVLGQSIPLAWALQSTQVTNLYLLATGMPTDATEEAVAADFPKLLQQLRQWFDWVIVDAGVWGELPSIDAVCANTDAVYLVARSSDLELPGFGGLRTEVKQSGGHVRGYISTRQ